MAGKRRQVGVGVVPGDPTDGSGRARIHLFVRDEAGPVVEGRAYLPIAGEDGQPVKQKMAAGPVRGRLACDPGRLVAPVERRGVVLVTMRTEEPGAVTCPGCRASEDYRRLTCP